MRTTQLALLSVVIIVAFGFGLLADTLMRDIEHENFQATEEALVDMANVLAAVVETSSIKDHKIDPALLKEAFPRALDRKIDAGIFDLHKTAVNTHVYVTDDRRRVLFDSDGGKLEGQTLDYIDVSRTLAGQYGARSTRTNRNDSSTSVLHIAAPIREEGKIVGVLTVRKPKLDQWFFVQQRRTKVQISTVLIGTGIALFVGAVIFWVLRPLRELTAYVQAIQRGERAPAPVLQASSDVRDLAMAVEDMRDELEGRDYAATFVQTLTHELKSPIAAIRATAELLAENNMDAEQRRRFSQSLRAETERTEHLIRQLLRLAEVERQKALQVRAGADLACIAQQAMHELESMAAAKQVRVTAAMPEAGQAVIQGDEALLRRAVMNLIENAIDFSPAGGEISVEVTNNDNHHVLTIRDHGPGIPEYALPRLFERFYSLKHKETGRKGSGLGLCFAKEAVELHAGSISLTNCDGGGAIARIELPSSVA